MTLKTIEIDELLYKELLKRKLQDESITDVIERLLKLEKNLPIKQKLDLFELKLIRKRKKIENFAIFDPEIWDRIGNFLRALLTRYLQEFEEFPNPNIFLDPSDGSYDVHWNTEQFELLLCIPADLNSLVHISGEKFGSPEFEIEARINFEFITEWILDWLKKIH